MRPPKLFMQHTFIYPIYFAHLGRIFLQKSWHFPYKEVTFAHENHLSCEVEKAKIYALRHIVLTMRESRKRNALFA